MNDYIYYPEPLRREREFYHRVHSLCWLLYLLPGVGFGMAWLIHLPVTNVDCILYGLACAASFANFRYAERNTKQVFYALSLWDVSLQHRTMDFEARCRKYAPSLIFSDFHWDRSLSPAPASPEDSVAFKEDSAAAQSVIPPDDRYAYSQVRLAGKLNLRATLDAVTLQTPA